MGNGDRVLLVEGQDDKHVVQHLCVQCQPMPQFHIVVKGGVQELLDSIIQEARVSGRKAVGILVDADDDLIGRWSALADRLRVDDIEVPCSPVRTGTLIDGTIRTPRIGIWLMPDNETPGELEDFVAEMIPDEDPIWPRSKCYIDCIPECDRRFTEKKTQRARIHAWLATREDPRRMGAAIGARDLHVDGALSTKFAEWLWELFR